MPVYHGYQDSALRLVLRPLAPKWNFPQHSHHVQTFLSNLSELTLTNFLLIMEIVISPKATHSPHTRLSVLCHAWAGSESATYK